MKKLISITLVFVMLLSLFSGTVLAADTDTLVVTAQNVRTVKNSWATVTLQVEQNPGFQGMSFYPVITDAHGNKVNWDWEVDTTFSDLSFDVNEDKMVVLTADGDQNNTGVLLQMRFFVDPDAALGEYSISFLLYNGECFDASGNSVSTELPVVSVGVTEILYGDANGDGIVNLLDVLQLRKYLVNLDVFTGESTVEIAPGADTNGDGVVNLIDVLLLRRYMASRDPETGESGVVLGPSVIEPSEPSEPSEPDHWFDDGKDYTYNTYSTAAPGNWNVLSYETSDDANLIDYLSTPFFTFSLRFDENGEVIPGEYVPQYEAAIGLEDVTTQYAEAWNLPGEYGYAFKITLRDDLTWENGDPIVAADFVYSMKEQLNPLFQHHHASTYYSDSFAIAGAENYVNQGAFSYIDDASCRIADLVKGDDGNYYTADGYAVYVAVDYPIAWFGSYSLKYYVDAYGTAYFGTDRWEELVALMDDNGLVPANDETLAMLSATTTANPNWGESDADLPNYLVYNKAYPEIWDFSQVGLIATGEYELVIILDTPMQFLDEEGNLTYRCVSEFSGLPLVHQATYEACKQAPAGSADLWTSTYCTSKETTMSWGAYKMESFQPGREYVLVRNTNWYGYRLKENKGLYQTDRIVEEVIAEWNTAWLAFINGSIDSISLMSNADDYRSSARAYSAPSTTTFFLILNGHMQAIENREAAADFDQATQDLEILTNSAFRKALGLSYDRDDFAASTASARSIALGIIGNAYIYDPETGAQYRNTEQAKQVLCDFYGVDVSQFASLDEAVDSITGYDPQQAKELFTQAFREGIAAGYINDANGDGICDQTIKIEYASASAATDSVVRIVNYLNEHVAEVTTGTPFEGKIEFFISAPYGGDWANQFRNGLTDAILAGWSGSAMNPFALTDLYTNSYMQYNAAWYDATTVYLTINVPVEGVNQDVTMSLKQWSDALNDNNVQVQGVTYNFGFYQADAEVRLDILAAIEGKILESYNYLPMLQDGSIFLLSSQLDYITKDYNYVLGFGGLKYATYNYTDEEWTTFVAQHGNDLSEEYKKTQPSPNFDPAAKSEGVMTYAEYAAAAMDSKVVIEAYVQATQSWWDNKITVYAQDPDGAYFIYDLACSEADAAKLTKGTKIRVTGYKGTWAGEIEIMDGTFEIVTDGTWVAEAKDVTALLGTDDLIKHQNEFVAFKGMTIEAINYKHGEPGDDIYVDVSYNGATYSFCVERYLTGPETDVYQAFASLKSGDKVDIEGFLYWYEGVYTHITSVKVVESYDPYAAGYDGSNVTITFYHTMGSNLSAVLNSYIEEFNQLYPNIHIQHEQVGGYDDVRDQIKTELTVGNQPNIAYCYPDHVALYNIARAVVTLDDLIASEVEIPRADGSVEVMGLTDAQIADFIEGFYNEGKQFGDGLMYTMPMSKSTEVLYYNKTFFEEHNLTVPTTWDEMEELCARILEIDPSCIPLGYDSESNWFINMCAQYGSDYTSATGEHFLFDNAVNRDFVARFRQWYQKGYVTTQEIYGAYTSGLFVTQTGTNSYMSIGSSAGATHQRPIQGIDGYPFEVGIAPIPQVDAENPKVISQGPSLCIFKDANPQEVLASWLFVKFLTTNVNFQTEFSMASGYVPVLKSVTQNRTYAQYLAKADGGDYITALSAQVCLKQAKAYYTTPGFNGSTTAREQVELLMLNAFTANDNGNVDVLLNELFTEAVEECRNTIGQTTDPTRPGATLEDAKAYLAAFYQGVDGTVVHNDFSLITTVMIDGVSFPVTWTTDMPDFVTICAPAYNMVKIDIIEHPADQVIFQLTGTVTDAQGNTASVTITRVIEAKIGGVTFVDAPVADTAYKYVVEQNNLGQLLYFTGEMSGHYLATSITSAEGVDVFVEDVAGGQRLYFNNAEGVKTYIDVVPRGEDQPGKVNIILTETPTCVYTWDAARKTFITTVADNTWYLGCYSSYNTISASNISYIENVEVIGDSQFPAGLCTVTYIEDPALAWSVIGEIGDSNWAVDFPMTKVNDNTWESAPLQLRAGANFKIRQGATWDVNYGADGEKNGPNFVVEADGNYKIQLILEGDVATINLIPV